MFYTGHFWGKRHSSDGVLFTSRTLPDLSIVRKWGQVRYFIRFQGWRLTGCSDKRTSGHFGTQTVLLDTWRTVWTAAASVHHRSLVWSHVFWTFVASVWTLDLGVFLYSGSTRWPLCVASLLSLFLNCFCLVPPAFLGHASRFALHIFTVRADAEHKDETDKEVIRHRWNKRGGKKGDDRK